LPQTRTRPSPASTALPLWHRLRSICHSKGRGPLHPPWPGTDPLQSPHQAGAGPIGITRWPPRSTAAPTETLGDGQWIRRRR
jgi:hypothetical protein